jgi:hypothetical protein
MLPAKVRSTLMLLHAAVSYELFNALERERKLGRARKIARPLLFNTWIGLVHILSIATCSPAAAP